MPALSSHKRWNEKQDKDKENKKNYKFIDQMDKKSLGNIFLQIGSS